jgi:hypothetical protein
MHDGQGIADRNRGVYRVAALFEYRYPDLCGQMLGRDHHRVFCPDRRRRLGGGKSGQSKKAEQEC